jgi:hypothetical protein
MFSGLPNELKLTIFGFVPNKGKIISQRVSREWSDFLKDKTLWDKTGAENYSDFSNRMQRLPLHLRNFVLDEKQPLNEAEKLFIDEIKKLNVVERQKIMISPDEVKLMPDYPFIGYLDALLRGECGIPALFEKLITPAQASKMKNERYISALLTKSGLEALRERLITPETANTIISAEYCAIALNPVGVELLKRQLITIEKINAFPTERHLKKTISKKGLDAINEGLITIDDAINMPTGGHLKHLLSDIGKQALRLRVITIDEAKNIQYPSELKHQLQGLVDTWRLRNNLTSRL